MATRSTANARRATRSKASWCSAGAGLDPLPLPTLGVATCERSSFASFHVSLTFEGQARPGNFRVRENRLCRAAHRARRPCRPSRPSPLRYGASSAFPTLTGALPLRRWADGNGGRRAWPIRRQRLWTPQCITSRPLTLEGRSLTDEGQPDLASAAPVPTFGGFRPLRASWAAKCDHRGRRTAELSTVAGDKSVEKPIRL